MTSIVFEAPPTCASMMKSDAFGRLIAGPVGSGKTTALVFELLRRACEQAPAQDGLRYTRFAIVRQTLKQLKDTVAKDIQSWLSEIARLKVSESTFYVEFGDVRSEWAMIPLDDPEDQRRLLSMQLTGAWMSECIEMDISLMAPLSGRIGRYPNANLGGCTWSGIVADTNMPSEGSDWWKFMEEPPADWQVWVQPSGMAAEAENLNFLTQTSQSLKLPIDHPERLAQGRTYYQRFINMYGEDSDWCKRYVYAQYGPDPSGTAVFRESFKNAFHVVDEILEPVYGHPIIIGQDFGRDPCSIICQLDHKGRLLVLQEVCAEDIGLEQHIERALRPMLVQPRYMGRPVVMVGDPAGVAKSTIYEETSFDALKRLGFSAFPAPTNDLDPRLRAVEAFLLAQRDGGPAILIDKGRCPTIVRALGGGYRYGKTKAGQRKPNPEKNEWSHIMDALQYVCLVAHGRGWAEMAMRQIAPRVAKPRQRISAAAWT
jgi:hypothetical protein